MDKAKYADRHRYEPYITLETSKTSLVYESVRHELSFYNRLRTVLAISQTLSKLQFTVNGMTSCQNPHISG
jgi:hypothetical protein